MSGSSAQSLQSFLVDIGYRIDKNTEQQFKTTLLTGTNLALNLGRATLHAAEQVERGLQRMAKELENLYFASQRTGATVDGIKAIQFAASQLGSSAGQALSALESVAKLMATNPGGEGFLRSLGVQTRNANGSLRDTADIMSSLGDVLRRMPLAQANVYANFLGIDYHTLLAMRQGMDGYASAYKGMLNAAHVNAPQVAKDAHGIMVELRTLGAAFDILGMAVVQSMGKDVIRSIRGVREYIVAHFDDIVHIIRWVANVFTEAAGVFVHMGGRVVDAVKDVADWFRGLDAPAKVAVEAMAAILLAWRVLNAGFLFSPLGIVIALGAGLLLLYDDYKTWKETGGKGNLIDWDKWGPGITQFIANLTPMLHAIYDLGHAIKDLLGPSLNDLFTFFQLHGEDMFGGAIIGLTHFVELLTHAVEMITAITEWDGDKLRKASKGVLKAVGLQTGEDDEPEGWGGYVRKLGRVINGSDDGAGDPETSNFTGQGETKGVPTADDKRKIALESAQFWKDQGFSDAGIAAMLSAENAESSFDPTKWGAGTGDNGKAGGAFQHHKERRDAILAASGHDVYSQNHMEILRGMLAEMALGTDPTSGQVFKDIQGASSARKGGELNSRFVERPGITEADRHREELNRGADALNWLHWLRSFDHRNLDADNNIPVDEPGSGIVTTSGRTRRPPPRGVAPGSIGAGSPGYAPGPDGVTPGSIGAGSPGYAPGGDAPLVPSPGDTTNNNQRTSQLTNTTHITVTGAGDARDTAHQIASQVDRANQSAFRNFQPAIV